MKSHVPGGLAARIAGFVTLFACSAFAPAMAGPRYQEVGNTAPSNSGPVRLAWFTAVGGDVSWRPDDQSAWSQAVRNLPVRQGAEITAANGGRSEIQFDDGSRLWMANGAVVTLRSLYSDADGEFTEIVVRDGTVGLDPRNARSVYQIDTPLVSVDAAGLSRFRVDARNGVQVRARLGSVTIDGSQGKVTLKPGDYLDLHSAQQAYYVQHAPPADSFDTWTSNLYTHEYRYWQSPQRHYVPDNISIVSDEMDDNGTWRTDAHYGRVWYPHESDAGWRPYHTGHWVWVSPFGWTWVASESWGWAPYHYGSWIHDPDGWAWVPGPAQQYWTPAAVDFCQDNGNIAWCPLAPTEVQYGPALSIGYQGGNWALSFSIGAAAVFYPTQGGYCVPRPWATGYINDGVYVNNVTNINNYYGGALANHNSSFGVGGYIPVNARLAAGASLAPVGAFGGRGSYQALPRGANSVFKRGRLIGAPTGSFASLAGPPAARLTPMALAPTRSLRQSSAIPQAVLARSVYHASGAPGNHAVVQQARTLAAGAVAVGAAARLAAHRTPTARPRAAIMTHSAGVAARAARPAMSPATHATPPASAAQRAAMQARAAVGLRPRTVGATASGAANRTATHAQNPPHQERTAQTPGTPQAHRAIQTRQAARPERSAPQAQQNRQPARQSVAPRVEHSAPARQASRRQPQRPTPRVQANHQPTRGSAPAQHRSAPAPQHRQPAHRSAAPRVERSAPPVRHQAPPQPQRSAPQRQAVQRSAPAPQNRQPARQPSSPRAPAPPARRPNPAPEHRG